MGRSCFRRGERQVWRSPHSGEDGVNRRAIGPNILVVEAITSPLRGRIRRALAPADLALDDRRRVLRWARRTRTGTHCWGLNTVRRRGRNGIAGSNRPDRRRVSPDRRRPRPRRRRRSRRGYERLRYGTGARSGCNGGRSGGQRRGRGVGRWSPSLASPLRSLQT